MKIVQVRSGTLLGAALSGTAYISCLDVLEKSISDIKKTGDLEFVSQHRTEQILGSLVAHVRRVPSVMLICFCANYD